MEMEMEAAQAKETEGGAAVPKKNSYLMMKKKQRLVR
jgi:hypothetical protein